MKYDGWYILSDYDGTLTNNEFSVDRKNMEAAKFFMESGGHLGIATGRGMMEIEGENDGRFLYNLASIFYNGAMVIDPITKKILWSCPVPSSYKVILGDFLKVFPNLNVYIGLIDKLAFINEGPITDQRIHDIGMCFHWRVDSKSNLNKIREILSRKRAWDVRMKLDDINEEAYKIMIHGEVAMISKAELWMQEQTREMGYMISSSFPFNLEIVSIRAGKGNAIRWLKNQLGDCRIVAIGDGENDVAMFEYADFSIAPFFSQDSVKALASYVLEPNTSVLGKALELIDRRVG